MTRRLPALVLALVAGTFAVPAAAKSPQEPLQLPPAYTSPNAASGELDNSRWWSRFGDAELDRLVDRGLESNLDLKTASSRIAEADALVIQRLAPLMPTASIDSSVAMAPTDTLGFQFGGLPSMPGAEDPPTLYYTASTALNVGVEIDITGKNVVGHRAAKLDRSALQQDRASQELMLTTSITRAYYDLVTAEAQLRVVDEQVKASEALLELTELRFETAQVTALDVLQQRQQVASTRALVPQARAQVQTFSQQLAVLLGEPPGRRYRAAATLPGLPPAPTTGAPADLLRARPDLRASRTRLEVARSNRKVARRSFAPALRLSGQYGFQYFKMNDANSQDFWQVGASLVIPLSTGGAAYGHLKQVQAAESTARYQYDQTALIALREVENALTLERERALALEAQTLQIEAARAALEQARARYSQGLNDYLTVLTALNTTQRAELDLITSQRNLLDARIQLHAALGDSRR